MKKILRLIAILIVARCLNGIANAQDIHVPIVKPNTALLKQVPWSNINNNYIFTPIYPASTIFIYVRNYSSATKNGVTLTVSATADPNLVDFRNNTAGWATVPILSSTGACGTTFTNGTVTSCFASSVFAAQVAISISGGTVSGTTDMADVFVSLSPIPPQSTSGAITQVIGPTPNGTAIAVSNQQPVVVGGYRNGTTVAQTAAVDFTSGGWGIGEAFTDVGIASGAEISPSVDAIRAMATADHFKDETNNVLNTMLGTIDYGLVIGDQMQYQAWAFGSAEGAAVDTVAPAAGLELLEVVGFNNPRAHFDNVTIGCSAACDVFVDGISTVGNTACTAVTAFVFSQTHTLNEVSQKQCTVPGTTNGVLAHLYLAASTSITFSLHGIYSYQNNIGVKILNGAVNAGTISVAMHWFER